MSKFISLLYICIITCSNIAFSQEWLNDTLQDKIERYKTSFRKNGLNNLDPIEGIFLATLKRSFRSLSNYSDSNKFETINRNVVIIIGRSPIDSSKFIISLSSDGSIFNGKYLPPDIKNYRFYIKKLGAVYKVTSNPNDYTRDEASMLDTINNVIHFKTHEYFPRVWDNIDEINIYKKIFPATIDDNIFKTGTGYMISPNGYVITNHHVISEASNIYLSNEKYQRIKAKIVYQDEANDIAILKTDIHINYLPYKITSEKSTVGSDVFTLGFPLSGMLGKNIKLTSGIVNANVGFDGNEKYLQFSAEIEPGNSGSPLFNKDGNVIGLVTAKFKKGTNIGYALKAKEILSHLKIAGIGTFDRTPSNPKTDLPSLYEKNKNFIFIIEIE